LVGVLLTVKKILHVNEDVEFVLKCLQTTSLVGYIYMDLLSATTSVCGIVWIVYLPVWTWKLYNKFTSLLALIVLKVPLNPSQC